MKKQKIREDNNKRRWIATQPAVARNDGQGGFTLVELVIVIAIVIILSVVSVPIYRGYTKQAKMSEGYALLGVIMSAQKAYYSQYGNFLRSVHSSGKNNHWTCNEEVLGIDARGNKYFSYFRISSGTPDIEKYYFRASVEIPEELRNTTATCLSLLYNLTAKNVADFRIDAGND